MLLFAYKIQRKPNGIGSWIKDRIEDAKDWVSDQDDKIDYQTDIPMKLSDISSEIGDIKEQIINEDQLPEVLRGFGVEEQKISEISSKLQLSKLYQSVLKTFAMGSGATANDRTAQLSNLVVKITKGNNNKLNLKTAVIKGNQNLDVPCIIEHHSQKDRFHSTDHWDEYRFRPLTAEELQSIHAGISQSINSALQERVSRVLK